MITKEDIAEAHKAVEKVEKEKDVIKRKLRTADDKCQEAYRRESDLEEQYYKQEITNKDGDGFVSIDRVNGWHTYYQLAGKKIEDNAKLELKMDGTIVPATAIITPGEYKGRGGMDESYSWENLSFAILVHGSIQKIECKKLQKARWPRS